MKRELVLSLALLALGGVVLCAGAEGAEEAEPFVVKPYVQLGDAPVPGASEGLVVLWHTQDREGDWGVAYRPADGPRSTEWVDAEVTTARRVAVATIEPHRVYRATMKGLAPGGRVAYRVRLGGKVVFEATAQVRKPAGMSSRVVVVGDIGAGSSGQKAIAHQVGRTRPDYAVVTGDIVYSRGRISEYRSKFFPVYNADADEAGPKRGAPLLRSVPWLPVVGNHDITGAVDEFPDALGYFLYWDVPRNGVPLTAGGPGTVVLKGTEENRAAFRAAAGEAFPGSSNYSFDYGDAHWTLIDTNAYVDLEAPALRDWIARDLKAAAGARWRFVAMHHPGFSASKAHGSDQRTRVLAPLFEAGGVDVVFAGHVHNYQRTHPLRFVPEAPSGEDRKDRVPGTWTLDTRYDGRGRTRPEGIVYVVTGAGGAGLYDPEQQDDRGTWQPFTSRFVSKVHSFTVLEIEGSKLTVRQIDADGIELDRFEITKGAGEPGR